MAAISSPAAIGHDWSSACPSENKIPADWLSVNTDPDTSDAAVIQGKQGFLSAYPYSALTNSTGSSDTIYYKDRKSNINIATHNKRNLINFMSGSVGWLFGSLIGNDVA